MLAFGHRASAAKGIDRPSGSPLFGSDGECVDVQTSTGGFAPTGLDSGVRHPISRGLERTGGEMGKRELDIFQAALGLEDPWFIAESRFDVEAKRLDIDISFAPDARFDCPCCGEAGCRVYDARPLTWRHLDFWQHTTYLKARVPRVRCDACGVKKVRVPWAREGSGFTLLFEGHVMTLVRDMPVAPAARMVREHDTRLWRIIRHYVDDARAADDHGGLCRAAFDETSANGEQDFVSLFVDLDLKKVLFVADGKDSATVGAFAEDLTAHGGDPAAVAEVCIDMSSAFIKGTAEHLPQAEITFDKFHAVKIVNEAVDKVRRAEVKSRPELTRSRYAWLKNTSNLTAGQRDTIDSLSRRNLKTARAYQIRLTFQEFYQQPSREEGERFLKKWYFWATHSRLQPMIDAAKTIKRHWNGIVRWHDTHIANGILEGINSLVQAAKAKARGYRTLRNLKAMIYLIAGKLDILAST
jgi:transposase